MSNAPGRELLLVLLFGTPVVLNLAGALLGSEGLRRAGGYAAVPAAVLVVVSVVATAVVRARDARDDDARRRKVETELELVAAGARLSCTRSDGTSFRASCTDGTWRLEQAGAVRTVTRECLAEELRVQGARVSLRK